MKKFLDLPLVVDSLTIEQQSSLRIHIPRTIVKDWSLCLQLLLENLIDSFIFRHNSLESRRIVEFRLETVSQSNVKEISNRIIIGFTTRDLDFIRHFFLRYYRDGVAEVDHIDIETCGDTYSGYITILVEESVPPVSPDEASRRFNMK
jgi:hypothetical protein